MYTMNKPKLYDICAPEKDIHFCPICHTPFLEEPEESTLFHGIRVCPHCKSQESILFFYWTNCKNLVDREAVYQIYDRGAFLINDSYTFIAFRADDESWDYTLIDEDGVALESGQLGNDKSSFKDIMDDVLTNYISSIYQTKEIPWTTASVLLNKVQ